MTEAIGACRFPATQSNMARLAVLYEYGGFYADLKNRPLRPFLGELLHFEAALVTEHPPTIPDHEGRLTNAFLGSQPGHPLWRSALKRAVRNVKERRPLSSISLTGIGNLENALGSRLLRTVFDDVSGAYEHVHAGGTQLTRTVDFVVIPSLTAWGSKGGSDGWMKRTRASYNDDTGAHWSQRERTESVYVDAPAPTSRFR